MMNKLFKKPFPKWSIPIALLVLVILSFGVLIPQLGFYWDDWETILVTELYDLSEFWNYFEGHRPLAAWSHILFGAILKTRPINWQIFTLLMRWCTAFGMLWVFQMVWPKNKRKVTLAAFLFAVYPLFRQQPISVAYHQHWTAFALFFLSTGFMVYAAKSGRLYWLYTLLGIVSLGLNLATLEYFVGVELLRPVLLWIIFNRDGIQSKALLRKTLKYWLPYLFVLLLFVGWRLYYSMGAESDPNAPSLIFDLLNDPFHTIVLAVEMVLQDVLNILITNWFDTLDPELINLRKPSILFSWVLAGLSALFVFFYVIRLKTEDEEQPSNWARQAMLVGFLSLILGSLPIWSTGRQSTITGLFADRFGMVSMFGASLMIIALVERIIKQKRQKVLVVATLIGLATGLHFRTANDFRWSWTEQQRVYWNLYWRAPSIEPQTWLMSDGDMFSYVRPGFSINLLYGQPEDPSNTSYTFSLLNRDYVNDPEGFRNGVVFQEDFRNFSYQINSQNSLILNYDTKYSSCLWVLSEYDQNDPYISDLARDALSVSNLERINRDHFDYEYPSTRIFGPEPEPDWCYLYQKAELARQYADWDEIIALGLKASEGSFSPLTGASNAPHEWMPFIEGYLQSEDVQEAARLSSLSFERDPKYAGALCGLWQRVINEKPQLRQSQEAYQDLNSDLGCGGEW
ncbi:MAG: hypothetical protein JEZ06_10620 [Anaerolineaceae bacterium]|nr:hypothetical protein [Anaerolineaceae bacterium]